MIESKPYSYWEWSICDIMRKNIKLIVNDNITKKQSIYYDDHHNKYKLIDEILDNDPHNDRVIYNNEIVLYNRYKDYDNNNHTF